ncbi:hypothetical protein Tco_0048658 [Tanacetum coccineum]
MILAGSIRPFTTQNISIPVRASWGTTQPVFDANSSSFYLGSEVSSIEKEKPQMKKIKNTGQEKKVISAYCSNTQRGDQQHLKSGAARGTH